MTDDAASERDLEDAADAAGDCNGDTDNCGALADAIDDGPMALETVETRLKAADRQLRALFEATEDLNAPSARRRLAETRRELLTIRHEFTAVYASDDDHAGHDIPPIVARGGAGAVETIVGPNPIAFERQQRTKSDES